MKHEGANVISIVMSPYNEVYIIDVEALPPRIPNIVGWYNYPNQGGITGIT